MDNSTIAAVATPIGRGGIGIIKISGEKALRIAATIFKRSHFTSDHNADTGNLSFASFKSHRLYHGHVINPANGRRLDEVLLAFMKAPRSYTVEDVVEIQAHSGPVVLSSILELVLKNGARLAEPGEFTKRAYINGRIDLTQAEAVVDIINARTGKALEIAFTQLQGDMRRSVEIIRESLSDFFAEINAAIDFPGDVTEIVGIDAATKTLQNKVVARLKDLIRQYENAHVLRDGLKLVVVGRPNVGKSSLMNRLLQKDRVIVTSMPGTTRDLIEEPLTIRGIPVIIADTAGLHETDDPVEVIGIKKTYEHTDLSDLVLFVLDAGCKVTKEDYKIYERIRDRKLIIVINKSDLIDDEHRLDIPDFWINIPQVKISALYNQGLDMLKELIAKTSLNEQGFDTEHAIIPNLRHKIALERSLRAASSAVEGMRKQTSFELIAINIKEAIDSLGEITGVVANEDMIDRIFSRFCIGK
ncbi:MAG: tRNA uridine-5-carboxymethylaminomethyl(34) synthesis GTPase MnmE [Thermodesulfobacteriota bacterium]|nr:tRNA uridine-5-carboxymethylaminomethyl(34) synthesis GTPase MnmE [Thermodesulfobacteriota bacterium]